MAKFASPRKLGHRRREAAERLLAAMVANPVVVRGSGRFDTRVMVAGDSRFAVKMGPEGVHVAIVPSLGLGIALKIDDSARRAAEWGDGDPVADSFGPHPTTSSETNAGNA